jgi:hypothetical protein
MTRAQPDKSLKMIKDGTAQNDDDGEEDDEKPFNKNINRFRDLVLSVWARALSRACPEIMTKANIAAMRSRGQRATSLTCIQELGELVSDVAPDDAICPTMRNKKKVIEFLAGRMQDRAYRFKKLILPVAVENQGPYKTLVDGGNCEVTLRWTGKKVSIKIPHASDIYVDNPHSTLRGTLRIKGRDWQKQLWPLFSGDTETVTKTMGNQRRTFAVSMTTRRRIAFKATRVAGPYSSPEPTARVLGSPVAKGSKRKASTTGRPSGNAAMESDGEATDLGGGGDVGCTGRAAGSSSGKGSGGGSSATEAKPNSGNDAALVHTLMYAGAIN